MSILKFKTAEEVVERANASSYGLVASVYTKDTGRALAMSHALRCGLVWVNSYNVLHPALPFGGVKQSGHGRDMSEYALQQYTVLKTVVIRAAF